MKTVDVQIIHFSLTNTPCSPHRSSSYQIDTRQDICIYTIKGPWTTNMYLIVMYLYYRSETELLTYAFHLFFFSLLSVIGVTVADKISPTETTCSYL